MRVKFINTHIRCTVDFDNLSTTGRVAVMVDTPKDAYGLGNKHIQIIGKPEV